MVVSMAVFLVGGLGSSCHEAMERDWTDEAGIWFDGHFRRRLRFVTGSRHVIGVKSFLDGGNRDVEQAGDLPVAHGWIHAAHFTDRKALIVV